MTTGTQIIDKTLRQVLSGVVEQKNKLAVSLNSTTDSVVMTYDLEGLRPGQVFEIDSELFYIWSASTGTKTLTVQRGFNGSTAASHSANALVTVMPRFPRSQVLEAINDELADLSSPMHGLFQVKSFDINYNGSDQMLPLPTVDAAIDLLTVQMRDTSTTYPTIRKVKLVRDLPTDDFSTGFALRFDQPTRNGRLRVVYKAPFTPLTLESQNINSYSGLPDTCEDIVNIGTQIRLMAPREIKRNFIESQGDTRRAEEVPVGAVGNSITNLLRMRRDRITAEAARLARQYPTFMSRD